MVFDELCSANGKTRDEMVSIMFAEYNGMINVSRLHLMCELPQMAKWMDSNFLPKSVTEEALNRSMKICTLSAVFVFFTKMRSFGLTEIQVMESLAKCCDDPSVFAAASAIMTSGGVEPYMKSLQRSV